MLGYTILLICAIAAFLFILEPLLRARRRGTALVPPARLADLQARRAYLLDGIRDLDFDYSMGKVGAEEYGETRNRYIREAAEVLRDLERETSVVDQEIDAEIARLRALARQPQSPPAQPPEGIAPSP